MKNAVVTTISTPVAILIFIVSPLCSCYAGEKFTSGQRARFGVLSIIPELLSISGTGGALSLVRNRAGEENDYKTG
jgi:hypothetical protein